MVGCRLNTVLFKLHRTGSVRTPPANIEAILRVWEKGVTSVCSVLAFCAAWCVSEMFAIVQEMRKQREQDAKERAEQLQSLKEEKSIFT